MEVVNDVKNKRGVFIKQRAFLKAMIIADVMQKEGYGLKLKKNIFESLMNYDYSPTNSEMYKSLYSLVNSDILERLIVKTPDSVYETVVEYKIKNKDRANYYISLVIDELETNKRMIEESIDILKKNAEE